MTLFKEKYINPFTDFGFKRLFGEEPSKDLLLDFLNELLRETEGEITEISFLPNEKLPLSFGDRRAIFDIYCTNERGEKFIVELQKAEQKFFKDRMLYYSTFPIQEQAVKERNCLSADEAGDFKLKNVYAIGILDFEFDEDQQHPNKYRYDVKLTEQETKMVFYDKLTYIYLAMPKFKKTEKELSNKFEKWLFVLRNLNKLDRIPVELKENIFLKLFKLAEISKMNKTTYQSYEESLNAYRDIKNSVETAFEKGEKKGLIKGIKEGIKEGEKKGRIEIALQMHKKGIEIKLISELTAFSEKELKVLFKNPAN